MENLVSDVRRSAGPARPRWSIGRASATGWRDVAADARPPSDEAGRCISSGLIPRHRRDPASGGDRGAAWSRHDCGACSRNSSTTRSRRCGCRACRRSSGGAAAGRGARGLASLADRVILDADDPWPVWSRIPPLFEQTAFTDLRWAGLTRWRAALAHFFDLARRQGERGRLQLASIAAARPRPRRRCSRDGSTRRWAGGAACAVDSCRRALRRSSR